MQKSERIKKSYHFLFSIPKSLEVSIISSSHLSKMLRMVFKDRDKTNSFIELYQTLPIATKILSFFFSFLIIFLTYLYFQREYRNKYMLALKTAAIKLKRATIKTIIPTKAHVWIPNPPQSILYEECCVCLQFFNVRETSTGLQKNIEQCSVCGVNVHSKCKKFAVKGCKSISMSGNILRHHWLEGPGFIEDRPPDFDNCLFCEEKVICNSSAICSIWHCLWCQRLVHLDCYADKAFNMHFNQPCDLGPNQRTILSPLHVKMTRVNSNLLHHPSHVTSFIQSFQKGANEIANTVKKSIRKRSKKKTTITRSHSQPSIANENEEVKGKSLKASGEWKEKEKEKKKQSDDVSDSTILSYSISGILFNFRPLLVFINSKSGARHGSMLKLRFNMLLNPIQVVELNSTTSPESSLSFFSSVNQFRVLVCGGDGTVSWILNTIENMKFENPPPVAILPVGTGNDLSRVLGWGGGSRTITRQGGLSCIIQNVNEAALTLVDRWKVTFSQFKNKNGSIFETSEKFMTNYFGIGCDAKVALEIHLLREENPTLFYSQFMNKVLYAKKGARDIMNQSCSDLPWQMKMEVDGKDVEISQDIQGLLILNIGSYMGGVDLWQNEEEHDDDFDLQCMHDKKIEVVGICGAWHLGKLQVGLSRALRLAQGHVIKIVTKSIIPFQIDGEPWLQPPSYITISHHSQSFMLKQVSDEPLDRATVVITDVLENAKNRGAITSSQHRSLLQDLTLALS